MIKILFLAANPSDTSRLRLDEEIRTIDEKLRQADFRDKYEIEQQWAVRVSDLQGCLLRHKPNIVHFSGHGSSTNEILLENEYGEGHPVSKKALSQLFSILKNSICCVVLNACYSEEQAQAIAECIEYVVGMSKAISDNAAICFSAAFYQALGYGFDIKTAYKLGCTQLELEGFDEQYIPKLLVSSNCVFSPLIERNPGASKSLYSDSKQLLSLEYFDIDTKQCSYEREYLSLDSLEESANFIAENERFLADRIANCNNGEESINLKWQLTHSRDHARKLKAIWKPDTPFFSQNTDQADNIDEKIFPVFLFTIYNASQRKILLHTIELQVHDITQYNGISESHILTPLALYDVKVPEEEGIFITQMLPQIAIAAGDIVSFHIRLVPSKNAYDNYSLNIRVLGSDESFVETGIFSVDLIT